ncbi:DUF5776 domain-containing protein [Lentilactobacillus rapi]|uniref:DUF5776 domain-containing protein n=1 Tax=Lentilactobacillus rapi TaxID=481723 RepID=UPI000A569200
MLEFHFFATLKPGKVSTNGDNKGPYKVPVKFYDSKNNLLLDNENFKITPITDNPSGVEAPTTNNELGSSAWKDNKLIDNSDQNISSASYYFSQRTEPGQYTFTLTVPKGYKVSNLGSWKLDSTNNTLTQTVNIDTTNASASNQYVSLGGFTATFPKGYEAGTSVPLKLNVTGPKGAVDSSDGSMSLSVYNPPHYDYYFKAYPDKSMQFGGSINSRYADAGKVTKDTPIISTLWPIDSQYWSDGINNTGGTGNNSVTLSSFTDKPEFDYPTNKLAFINDDSFDDSMKAKLDNNEVYGTYKDGNTDKTVKLGTVKFGTPLTFTERNYTSIKVDYSKTAPVKFTDGSLAGKFEAQLTGHMTEDAINDFKSSGDSEQDYSNDLDASYSQSTSDYDSNSNSDYVGLTKDVPEINMDYSDGLTLIGQAGNQMLGGHPLKANFRFIVNNNENLKLQPKNGRMVYIVPDGVSYDTKDPGDVQNLKNIQVEPNYNGSSYTAITADITNPSDFNDSGSTVSYQLPLAADDSVISGQYNVSAFFVLDNNNGKAGSKTDFGVNSNANKTPDVYGLYQNTANSNAIISDKQGYTYLPDRKLVNSTLVSIFNPETGQYGTPVQDTGNSAYVGDKLMFHSSLINDGFRDYSYLDTISVLPYAGDKTEKGDSRGSNTQLPLTGPVQVPAGYTVSYSTDKVLYPILNNYTSSKVKFSDSVPNNNYEKVTMIRLKAKSGTVLKMGQKIEFTYPSKVPDISKTDPLADKAKAVNSFFVRTSGNNDDITESHPAKVFAKQPYVDVTIQYYDQATNEPIVGKQPTVVADQKIGDSFSANAADYPIEGYQPVDSQDHKITVSRDLTKNVIKLYYKKTDNTSKVSGVAQFQDQSGQSIASDIDFSGISGYRYNLTKNADVIKTQKKLANEQYRLVKTIGQPIGIFTKDKLVNVVYQYEKSVNPTPPEPNPKPTPTPSPTPTPAPTPQPTTTTEPSVVAKKGEAVYALKKIYLYKNNTFVKKDRQAGYVSKPRVYRPMFVVTGYSHSKNGHLRYKVRDVNHLTKNRHKKGYITANWSYVRPVYYQSKHKTLTVINPRGVNAYKKTNLTNKVRNYKQGTILHVTKFVHHNLTTRYVLSNGNYITGNRKLVKMGKQKMPRYVKVKKNINRYKTVNLTKRNKHIKKGTKIRIKNYDYSQANSVTKHGALRYRIAGGYITGNSKYVKIYY